MRWARRLTGAVRGPCRVAAGGLPHGPRGATSPLRPGPLPGAQNAEFSSPRLVHDGPGSASRSFRRRGG
eukprot:5730202-Alexandrium_andersonii.AAC.1